MPLLPQTPLARRRRLRALAIFSLLVLVVVYFATRSGSKNTNRASAVTSTNQLSTTTTAAGAPPTHGLAMPATYLPGVPANHDRANLYYYFPSKDDLLRETLATTLQRYRENWSTVPDDATLTELADHMVIYRYREVARSGPMDLRF